MILALVGAAFILGKLREPASELQLKTGAAEGNLKGQSPGLFLAFLGTILMVTTIVTHNEIETKDPATYTNMLINAQPSAKPPPEPLGTAGTQKESEEKKSEDNSKDSIRSRMERIMRKSSKADTPGGR